MNQNRLKKYSCCKIVLQANTTLYKSCMYISTNSTTDSNDLPNQTIADASKLKGELFLLGDFNCPNINGRNYMFLIILNVVRLNSLQLFKTRFYIIMFLLEHILNQIGDQP